MGRIAIPLTERECACCGKIFMPNCGARKYCGYECEKEMARQQRQRYEKKAKKEKKSPSAGNRRKEHLSITEIQRLAHERGMTYGQYTAMIYAPKLRRHE